MEEISTIKGELFSGLRSMVDTKWTYQDLLNELLERAGARKVIFSSGDDPRFAERITNDKETVEEYADDVYRQVNIQLEDVFTSLVNIHKEINPNCSEYNVLSVEIHRMEYLIDKLDVDGTSGRQLEVVLDAILNPVNFVF